MSIFSLCNVDYSFDTATVIKDHHCVCLPSGSTRMILSPYEFDRCTTFVFQCPKHCLFWKCVFLSIKDNCRDPRIPKNEIFDNSMN